MIDRLRTVALTGSTNGDVLRAAREGAAEGIWLRALEQGAGRGRLGREWVSPPGNLYASTLVRVEAPSAATIAFVAAVALEEALRRLIGAQADELSIKWPNDLLLRGAKLAGILVEREGSAVVVGFGVNLASAPELSERLTAALASQEGEAPTAEALLDALIVSFDRWLERWRTHGFAPVRERWLACAHPEGTPLTASLPDGRRIVGSFAGLEADGALRLHDHCGLQIIRAADVVLA